MVIIHEIDSINSVCLWSELEQKRKDLLGEIKLSDQNPTSREKLGKDVEINSIPYVIVGGVAVIVTGRTRMTTDVDIILNHERIQRENFVKYLVSEGFDANIRDFDGFDEEGHCSIFFKEGMFRIDIKGTYSELDHESIEMALDEAVKARRL